VQIDTDSTELSPNSQMHFSYGVFTRIRIAA